MNKILIIDDDERLAAPLQDFFQRHDLDLSSATTPSAGLDLLNQGDFELVILDVMLPEMDGFEVCRRIRQSSQIPIVMLSARGQVDDRLSGLELGADDYLAKPFEPRELVVRIHNILRRSNVSEAPSALTFDGLHIDTENQSINVLGNDVSLTTNEMSLLCLLASLPGKPLSRDDILNRLKGTEVELFSRAVDIQISRLRQKLKPLDCIKTVWGSGYKFVPPAGDPKES